MMNYIYNVSNLYKEYNGKAVLDIENLNIEREKITALIGPSGAGKSTLLQILNFIESPDKGNINFDGLDLNINKLDINIRRQISMVFQKPILFNSTVYENIAYSLKIRKKPKNVIKERVEEIVNLIGLTDKANQNALTLSGGEAQRVAMARSIIIRPKVLLLDEPTSNLDPANIVLIEKLIKHAKSEYKTSIIIVTHNMHQAKRLSDNVVFLLDGKVVEYGQADQVLLNPENKKTHAFICGEMIY